MYFLIIVINNCEVLKLTNLFDTSFFLERKNPKLMHFIFQNVCKINILNPKCSGIIITNSSSYFFCHFSMFKRLKKMFSHFLLHFLIL